METGRNAITFALANNSDLFQSLKYLIETRQCYDTKSSFKDVSVISHPEGRSLAMRSPSPHPPQQSSRPLLPMRPVSTPPVITNTDTSDQLSRKQSVEEKTPSRPLSAKTENKQTSEEKSQSTISSHGRGLLLYNILFYSLTSKLT